MALSRGLLEGLQENTCLVRAEEAQAIAAAAFLDGKKKVDAVKPKEIKRSSNGRGNKKVSNKATVQRKN